MRFRVAAMMCVVLVAMSGFVAADASGIQARVNDEVAAGQKMSQRSSTEGTINFNGWFNSMNLSASWTGPLAVTANASVTTTITSPAYQVPTYVNQFGRWWGYLVEDTTAATYFTTTVNNRTPRAGSGAGAFTTSMSFSAPAEGDYFVFMQGYGQIKVGTKYYFTGTYTAGPGSNFEYNMVETGTAPFFVGADAPPTATPDPNAGGTPIPTMNRWGVLAMIVLLAGVAMLLFTRRS